MNFISVAGEVKENPFLLCIKLLANMRVKGPAKIIC